tara:strand:+ start:357 stop:824 length:468 start_codon:yes stop_codon:yes gene_type:complete
MSLFNQVEPLTSHRETNLQKAKDEAIKLLQETGEHHSVMGISTANFTFRVINSVLVLTEEDMSPWYEEWSTFPAGQSMYHCNFVITDYDSNNGLNVIHSFETKDEAINKFKEIDENENNYQLLKMFELKKEFLHILNKFEDDNFKPISKSFYGIY